VVPMPAMRCVHYIFMQQEHVRPFCGGDASAGHSSGSNAGGSAGGGSLGHSLSGSCSGIMYVHLLWGTPPVGWGARYMHEAVPCTCTKQCLYKMVQLQSGMGSFSSIWWVHFTYMDSCRRSMYAHSAGVLGQGVMLAAACGRCMIRVGQLPGCDEPLGLHSMGRGAGQ
jgi:hypothetical protein